MTRKEKQERKRQDFEYRVTGRLPRRYRRETKEHWYLTDAELRTALENLMKKVSLMVIDNTDEVLDSISDSFRRFLDSMTYILIQQRRCI